MSNTSLLAWALVSIVACAHRAPPPCCAIEPQRDPYWLLRGGGGFATDDGPAFFGVGLAARDLPNRRAVAEQRAREDMKRVLTELWQEIFAHDADEALAEYFVVMLPIVPIIDRGRIRNNDEAALARLTLAQFLASAETFLTLPMREKLRSFVRVRA